MLNVFLFAAAFIDRRLGFVERRGLTRMTLYCTAVFNKMRLDLRGGRWVESEPLRLCSEI